MIFSLRRPTTYFSTDVTSNHLFDGLSVNSSFESSWFERLAVCCLSRVRAKLGSCIHLLRLHLMRTSLAFFATNLFSQRIWIVVATAIKVHSVLQNKDKIGHGDLSGLCKS